MSEHLSKAQNFEPRFRSAPSTDVRVVPAAERYPRDTATLADKVLVAIARLLGRQAAREWFEAEG